MSEPTTKQRMVWLIAAAGAAVIAGVGSILGLGDFQATWTAIIRFLSGVGI